VPKSVSDSVVISNRLGLHARPAMMFVETASKFGCDIRVCRADGAESVDGKSIMQMMMLAATNGTEIKIVANGDDAAAALRELLDLVESRFNED
jgi:phosphocarrier protein